MRRAIDWLLVFSFALTSAVGASEVLRVSPEVSASDASTSVVLTPAGVQRQVSAMRAVSATAIVRQNGTERTVNQVSDAPTWSTGQTWLLGLATMIACNAWDSVCSSLRSSTPLTPPGWEAWRREGCTAPNTCPAWMYPPP